MTLPFSEPLFLQLDNEGSDADDLLGFTERFANIMKAVTGLSPDRCHISYKFRVVVTGLQVKNMETL